ncbi:alkaline phosphatase domain-containing protein [Phthorimaea operculella]|nr:alkaline phosphatase domain-containing protein [Phthorimaea operculella]
MFASKSLLLTLLVAVTINSGCTHDRDHPDTPKSTVRINNKIGQINNAERFQKYWEEGAQEGILKRLREVKDERIARNIIMFVGDGLSIPTMTAARILKGQRQNRTGEETELFFETFPTVGLSKTYCINQQIPDSGCTASAYLTGIKVNYGVLGLNGEVERHDCLASMDKSRHLESIAAWAIAAGKDAGIVTNTRITHASPGGAYAKAANRHWETDYDVKEAGYTTEQCPDIAHQLINSSPGNQFKVIFGGGRREFITTSTVDEEGNTGRRTDGRNLIEEWKNNKDSQGASFEYVWNRSQLMSAMNSPPEYLLGLFNSNHMSYHMQSDPITEPTLAELTEAAIKMLNRNEKGFFLFVEGGRIDHGHHQNWHHLALDETIEMDKAVQKAIELVGDDSLVVVTSDHTHVMTINGFTERGTDILGASDRLGWDGTPMLTLSYTNGPGARTHVNGIRPDVTKEEDYLKHLEWRAHAEVPMEEETHGGDDVPVLAHGPHHHMFTGLYEQNQIPWRMAYAACIGPGLHADGCNAASTHLPLFMLYVLAIVLLVSVMQR